AAPGAALLLLPPRPETATGPAGLHPAGNAGPAQPGRPAHPRPLRPVLRMAKKLNTLPETPSAPALGAPGWRRFLTPWRSPADQPGWARPALLAIAVVAAVAYGWG